MCVVSTQTWNSSYSNLNFDSILNILDIDYNIFGNWTILIEIKVHVEVFENSSDLEVVNGTLQGLIIKKNNI